MDSANFSFLKNLDVDFSVESKLSRILGYTLKGNNVVLTTPFGKDIGIDNLFEDFNKMFDSNQSKMNSVLLELERSNKAKFGPRSIASPWKDRKPTLLDSFELKNYDTLSKVSPLCGRARLRPLTLENALKYLKNRTSSGLPYMTDKGIIKDRVLDKFDTLLKRKDPAVLFTRTQEGGKTRNVWGFPVVDTLNEMRYYQPLLSYQKELKYRSALISPELVSARLTELVIKSVKSKSQLISVDFSLYDNSVKAQAQKIAFDYIRSLFQPSESDAIDEIAKRFSTIGILTPDGVYNGNHGVPSGSTFTNEVDSIVQATIALSLPFIQDTDFQVQGDDGVYLVPQNQSDQLFENFDSCGLLLNKDKSFVSQHYAIYLQSLYHIDYLKNGNIGGIYPIYRALNRLVYQERWSDFEEFGLNGKDYYSIRAICILENCKHHPLFKELVKFVLKHDKYSLVSSKQGINNYVQMIEDTKGAGEILKHQYGSDVSGIRNFETFKLIKELG